MEVAPDEAAVNDAGRPAVPTRHGGRDEESYVRVAGLSKSYGTFAALRDVSFEVYAGEFVCLLGPSGCGKTTLLRAIAGLEPQATGDIRLGGRDVSRLPPAKRNFGIVFQSYALFPNLTIRDNIAYGLVARRVPRQKMQSRVVELLDLVGLRTEIDKYPGQLSGGQQQRVALARALATSPSLLLLDEPLSALDAQVRVHLREEIRALQKRIGITTILVTHDQEEALAVADRVLLMREGRIEQIGTPEEIYDRPATDFVIRFVGESRGFGALALGGGRFRAGSLEITADTAAAVAPGSRVTAYIRPEDVHVGPSEPASANRFATTVRTLTFKGSHWQLALEVAGVEGVTLLADVRTQALRRAPLREGDALAAWVHPHRIRVFPAT